MNGAEIAFGGSIIAIVAFVLGNARAEASKRASIYTKIDEERLKAETLFVRKDVCGVHHQYLEREIKAMNEKLDTLLANGKH